MGENAKCNHIVGATTTCDYGYDLVHADYDGDGADEFGFSHFVFCPCCGAQVTSEANEVQLRINAHWEQFWLRYAKLHGEDEMRRARKMP